MQDSQPSIDYQEAGKLSRFSRSFLPGEHVAVRGTNRRANLCLGHCPTFKQRFGKLRDRRHMSFLKFDALGICSRARPGRPPPCRGAEDGSSEVVGHELTDHFLLIIAAIQSLDRQVREKRFAGFRRDDDDTMQRTTGGNRAKSVMVHGIPAPGLFSRNYFNRYSADAVDLCDVLASYTNQAKASLDVICKTMGLRGKGKGIRGADVEAYVNEGRIREVSEYCETDVVNTFLLWLRYEVFRGALTKIYWEESEQALRHFVFQRPDQRSHLLTLFE